MKKVISLFLAIIMILSIGTVGVSAASYSITLAPTLDHVRKDNMAYYPVRYDLHKSPNAYAEFCASNGVNAVSTHIELGYTYDAETLKFVDVLPSETLYNAGGTIKVKEQGTDKYGDDYFIVEIDFTGTEALSVEYFFNLQFEVLQEKFFYSGVAIARTLVSHYPVYEDIENYDIRYCFWNVTDSNGEVHDLSKNVYTSYIVMTEFMEPDYNQLLIKDYEPFIPPVEDDNVENGIYDRITISSDVYHARKGDYAYFPVYYDCKTAYSEIADNDSGSSTKIILAFLYNDHLIEPVEAIPSEQLYNIGGTTEIIRVDKYVDEDAVAIPYIYVEVNFDGCIDINNDVLFNVKFEVISDNFFDEYGRLDMGGLFDEFWLVDDDNVLTFHFSEWKINKSNGNVKNISTYVTTNSASQFTGGTYDDLLLKNYEPFIPPVEQTTLNVGTTDTIHFESDETKIFKFTPETNGDYKITVSAAEKAGLNVLVYKNGELIEKTCVTKWGEDFPFSFVDDSILTPSVEFTFEGLSAGDEIKLELIDGTHDEGLSSQMSASWMPYFTPSSVTITVENVTSVVEEEPLFEFGVTAQHIRNRFDMLYYPVSFGFSMYDDADIRYSDICADVADLAFGCDTEVVMKYIYDAATLDFVSVYEDFWEGSVEVLEHGSTGETGPDGQEYNYIVIKAKFIAVGYANDTAPYYLKFAVVEDNFINSDGTVRKVIDNVPYSEDQLCVWNAWDAKGNSFDFSDKIKFKSSDYETDGYTYDNLLLEDDLIPTDVSMPTVTFTPEHARKDDLAYYPCMYDSNVDYEEWVHSATGFKDSTTKIQIKVNYDSSTLELLDALPSKELYDLGGTVTIIETGDLYPDDHENSNLKYAVIQIEFDALDFNEGCLFSLKFRVLQENFLDEEGYPIDLVNSFVADWVVTSNAGKSHDLRYYVSSSYVGFDTFSSYEELILADYEPFDPILLTDVTEVTYVQQEDTHKTFTVTVNGRKQMIQFIEPDGGTRTYDRYNKNVKITSYNADGEVVSSMARDLAYEVWEIYSNMSVGVEIQVRGKENYKWDEFRYSFTIEPYNPIISMELSATSGKKGAVPATVVADEKTEKVMFKMPNGTSVTVASTATDENGNKIFIGNAWMNEDGLNEIEVKIYRKNVWKSVGTLEYTVG